MFGVVVLWCLDVVAVWWLGCFLVDHSRCANYYWLVDFSCCDCTLVVFRFGVFLGIVT